MKGIDIASMQGNIDFAKVKATGIEIVYIKATEGLTYNNPFMKSQYNSAKSAGLKVGFYHYLRANDAVAEAEHMLKVTQGLQVECKYIIDAEEVCGQTKAKINSNVRRFADHLISKGLGVGIYTGDSFYSDTLDTSVKDLSLWVAHYGVSKPNASSYVGFQSTDKGRVNGVNGCCDIDDFSTGILNKGITINNIVGSVNNMSIKNGENSNRVKLLQSILNCLICKTDTDGIFGPGTLSAVQSYQKKWGLTVDGVVGLNTVKVLMLDMQNNWFKIK